MKEKLIPVEKAQKIYDLLASIGGAAESMRESFIYHHCEAKDGCDEWRFQGKLGTGGKYYSRMNRVDSYTEDRTQEVENIINELNYNLSLWNLLSKYTGKAWKHHIAEDFISGRCPISGGAGEGGTIFTDYAEMLKYLSQDGREWYAAELDLIDEQIVFEFGNIYMATTTRNIPSSTGFKSIDLWS